MIFQFQTSDFSIFQLLRVPCQFYYQYKCSYIENQKILNDFLWSFLVNRKNQIFSKLLLVISQSLSKLFISWHQIKMMSQKSMINPETENSFKGIIYPDVSTLPSESNFIYLIDEKAKKAYVETFDHQDIKIEEVLNKFIKRRKYKIPGAYSYRLILKQGVRIDNSKTMEQLKIELNRESIQGLQFKIEACMDQLKEKQYIDQCCTINYYCKQSGSRVFICLLVTILPQGNLKKKQIMMFKINRNDDEEKIVNKLVNQISETFFNLDKLTQKEISITKIKISKNGNKKRQMILENNVSSMKGRLFFDNYQLQVVILRKNITELQRKIVKKYNSMICIYKQDEKQPIKFDYDKVANLTVQELYFNYLQLQESQKKKQAIYCLKISDMILAPEDKISKAQIYFATDKPGVTKNVVAKVVNEKMIFYSVIPKISQKVEDQFSLDHIQIPEHQSSRRKQCWRILESRSKKASDDYFKHKKNLEPIVVYSSDLIYRQRETKQDLVIYQSLNKILRQSKILTLDSEDYSSNWKFIYASTLLKHLNKIPDFEGETWRGISFDPNYKKQQIGQIFTFKQFLSTSKNLQIAVKFAMRQDALQPYNMYYFSVKTGKNIIDYSFYEEGEILIQPFTEFQLIDIRKQILNGKQFIFYEMEEKKTSKKLPSIMTNFVVWIDSDPEDGRIIFNNIQNTSDSTFLIQLQSTAQFKTWSSKHKDFFSNSDAKIILITNMTRLEGNNYNEYAGIEALELARQRNKHIHAYFYIGNVNACYGKLQSKNISISNIRVTNRPQQMKLFLEDQLKA